MGEVWRGGSSTGRISQEKQSIQLGNGKSAMIPVKPDISHGGRFDKDEKKGVKIRSSVASKGGGTTSVLAWLDPLDFVVLAECMLKADPETAKQAFASAVANPNATQEKFMREYHERELAKLNKTP
jgi:hypothetical protein